jgi:hypothetical protein
MKVIANKRANVTADYGRNGLYVVMDGTEYGFHTTTAGGHVVWTKGGKRRLCNDHIVWVFNGRNGGLVLHHRDGYWTILKD